MNKKYLVILTAVLLVSTALYTKYIFFPTVYSKEVAETPVLLDIEQEETEESKDLVQNIWQLEVGRTDIMSASLLNRELPAKWKGKKIRFKYTYLGEYTESTQSDINTLLSGEYKWQKQLDSDGNIVLGGVMFKKDGIYQLHVHNGLSIAKRHYLFGDLLHHIYINEGIEGSEIQLGELKLKAVWSKDTEIYKDSTVPANAQIIISTCFERNGDRRLISGWIVE